MPRREGPLLVGIVGLQFVLLGLLLDNPVAVLAGIGLALSSSAWTARDKWIASGMAPIVLLEIAYDLGFVPLACHPSPGGGSWCATPTPPEAVEAWLTYLAYASILYLAWRLLRPDSRNDDPLPSRAVVAGGEGLLEILEVNRTGRERAPVERS